MNTSTRVIFNTFVLYAKILVSMSIALISVPLVLKALGASDYGLYNLVSGVVAMLSFLNNSMTVSSQRYMSVAMGEGNEQKVNIIYNTSFALHLALGILIVLAFEVIGIFAIDKLNIDLDRVWCAKIIFQFLILSTFSKIVSVPFDALMNAKEDMLPFSVIELIDSLLTLLIAFTIQYFTGDKLIFYGLCVAGIAVITFFMKYGWCRWAYKEYRIKLSQYKGLLQTKEMLGFTGWNLFGGVALIGRNQGVAIVFNLFNGTLANAAYGIANQINGALCNFSTTFQRAINPQLMKSEGMGDRERLSRISFITSKFSILALSLFAVPLIIEMDDVLNVWLKTDIPPYTLQLARCILILSIFTQASMGLMAAIQATGHIRNYQLVMGTLILTNIPVSYVILKLGFPIYYATVSFIIIEVISLVIRVIMAERIVGISSKKFLKNVIAPNLVIICVSTLLALIPTFFLSSLWGRLISVCCIYAIIYLVLMWFIAFDIIQRRAIIDRVLGLVKKKEK